MARVLRPGGLLVANLADRAPFPYLRRAVAAAREAFPHLAMSAEAATLRGRRYGNVVLIASDAAIPTDGLRRRAASSPFPYRVLDDAELRSVVGKGVPFTDDDAAPSPGPPGGATFFG